MIIQSYIQKISRSLTSRYSSKLQIISKHFFGLGCNWVDESWGSKTSRVHGRNEMTKKELGQIQSQFPFYSNRLALDGEAGKQTFHLSPPELSLPNPSCFTTYSTLSGMFRKQCQCQCHHISIVPLTPDIMHIIFINSLDLVILVFTLLSSSSIFINHLHHHQQNDQSSSINVNHPHQSSSITTNHHQSSSVMINDNNHQSSS